MRTISTEQGACLAIAAATFPTRKRVSTEEPCEPTKTKSDFVSSALQDHAFGISSQRDAAGFKTRASKFFGGPIHQPG
jgi:hypothetical protein